MNWNSLLEAGIWDHFVVYWISSSRSVFMFRTLTVVSQFQKLSLAVIKTFVKRVLNFVQLSNRFLKLKLTAFLSEIFNKSINFPFFPLQL